MNGKYLAYLVAGAALLAGLYSSTAGPPSDAALLADWSAPPPWPVFHAATWLTKGLDRLRDAVTPPPLRVMDHIWAITNAHGVYVLAKLNVPDLLKEKPLTAAELAPLTGVKHATELDRVLRMLVVQNMLGATIDASGVRHYQNNKLSAALRSDHPNSMRNLAMTFAEDCYAAWGHLVPGLQQGVMPFQLWAGSDLWAYEAKHPEQEAQFSRAMSELDNLGMQAMLKDYAWGQYSRVLDIAGAYGSTLAAILESQPALKGVLFDQPQVVERAEKLWMEKRAHLLNRTAFAAGNFFEAATVPASEPDGDLYLLRMVLHDWDDDKTIAILKSVRLAIGKRSAKVVILELMPTESPLQELIPARPQMDVHMLVMTAGSVRTEREWGALLPQAGFKLNQVVPTRSAYVVTEAVPV